MVVGALNFIEMSKIEFLIDINSKSSPNPYQSNNFTFFVRFKGCHNLQAGV